MTDREEFEKWYSKNFGGVAKVFKGLRRGNVYPQESMCSVNTAWAAWQAARTGEGGYDGSKDYSDKTGHDGSKGASQ